MTFTSRIDMGETTQSSKAEVILGEDWVAPAPDAEGVARPRKQGFANLNRSPLARKIVTFNLVGLILLVAGVLYLNTFRDSLVMQHERSLVAESRLIASGLGTQIDASGSAIDLAAGLARMEVSPGLEVVVFDPNGARVASIVGKPAPDPLGTLPRDRSTVITDFLNGVWGGLSRLFGPPEVAEKNHDTAALLRALIPGAAAGQVQIRLGLDPAGHTIFTVASPIRLADGSIAGVLTVASAAGEIDQLVRNEREQVLQMFIIAILVSIGLSLVLASTIANPLSDLAAAAEIGRDRNARKMSPGRVRIPDLAARPDEIGRLSIALRGMVAALYDRIDANEQFAADVAHEIKNPLASLRSAVASMRLAKRDDQREKLLSVIDHDVRRLDRLVSDISNASRLDSELVKEEEESFNLLRTIANLCEYLGQEAAKKKVDFITDLPGEPIQITGLEARLAQVFVNLITNAISFCEEGDAVRVWARKRENRVLVVVEDTGPGIPEQALTKIFKRFYSERPPGQFGDHSGLGLAISKQIVEAHGGVIWAENIRPTDADPTSDPLGARFVVGLPV